MGWTIVLSSLLTSFFLVIPFVMYFYHPSEVKSHKNVPNEIFALEGFNYTHWTNASEAVKEYTFSGDVIRVQDQTIGLWQSALWKELVMTRPQVIFYDHDQEYARLMAGEGRPDVDLSNEDIDFVNSQQVTFKENPTLVNNQGRVLSCGTIVWNKSARAFKGEDHCRLQLGDEVVQAPVIIADQKLTTWYVPGQII